MISVVHALFTLAVLVTLLGCNSKVSSSASSDPPPTANATTTAPSSTGSAVYFGTEASHAAFLPRSDSYCASAVVANSQEPRPDNQQANHTVVSPPHAWSNEDDWPAWRDKRAQVDGSFTGSTTTIIQWAACKWGIDEDTIRAAAVQESNWHMSEVGDVCGPPGEASYGILQIKNRDCSGTWIHGGYPHTQQSTALNADWYAARMRSCYDGDFYGWLYDGQTVDQLAAKNGWSYVFWTCIGFHFSGDWSPGQRYELQVRQHLAARTWESPNF